MKINQRLREIYFDEGIETVTKVKNLFYVLVIMSLVTFSLSALYVPQVQSLAAFSGFICSAVFILCLVLLFKKRFKLSANLTLLTLYLVVFYVNLNNRSTVPDSYLTVAVAYYISTMLCVALFGYSKWLAPLVTLGVFVNMLVILFTRSLPAFQQGLTKNSPWFDFAIAAFNPVIVGGFVFILLGNQEKIVKEMKQHTEVTRNGYEKMNEVVLDIQKSMSIGSELSTNAKNTVGQTLMITQLLEIISQHMQTLKKVIEETAAYQNQVVVKKDHVHEQMGNQSAAVTESSAAIEEMMASLKSISKAATDKNSLLTLLQESAGKLLASLQNTLDYVQKFKESSDTILDVVNIIKQITARTSMLSMNAAIEAAHAGDAGLGFAVVADEIRSLAEETDKNSKAIKVNLKQNIDNINNTLKKTRDSFQLTNEVMEQIRDVSHTLAEIIHGMGEISHGAEEVVQSAVDLQDSNHQVNLSLDDMTRFLTANFENVNKIQSSAVAVERCISDIRKKAQDISQYANTVSEIGLRNQENITELENRISGIKSNLQV